MFIGIYMAIVLIAACIVGVWKDSIWYGLLVLIIGWSAMLWLPILVGLLVITGSVLAVQLAVRIFRS